MPVTDQMTSVILYFEWRRSVSVSCVLMTGAVRTPDFCCCLAYTILFLVRETSSSFVACFIYRNTFFFLKGHHPLLARVLTSCYFQAWDTTTFLSLEGKREPVRPSIIQHHLILPMYTKPLPEDGKTERKGKGRKKSKKREGWRWEGQRENSFPACS